MCVCLKCVVLKEIGQRNFDWDKLEKLSCHAVVTPVCVSFAQPDVHPPVLPHELLVGRDG